MTERQLPVLFFGESPAIKMCDEYICKEQAIIIVPQWFADLYVLLVVLHIHEESLWSPYM